MNKFYKLGGILAAIATPISMAVSCSSGIPEYKRYDTKNDNIIDIVST
jgi:hypothetical protein